MENKLDLANLGIIKYRCNRSFTKTFLGMVEFKNLGETIDDINLISTNVLLTDKPGSWFLLGKCFKNSGRVTF